MISNYLIHSNAWEHLLVVLQYTKLLGPMSTWEIFSITTTEKQNNNKTPPWTASWLWRDGWMSKLSSNWTSLSAMNMCFLGDRKQILTAEVVQLISLYRKWNLYQRHWRKLSHAESYSFITEEETIQSYKTTQCTSLLMIHKIKHHSTNSLQQFQYDIVPC